MDPGETGQIATVTKILITGCEAARRIGCSYQTVYNLTREGELVPAAYDNSGNALYDPDTVADFASTYTDRRRASA